MKPRLARLGLLAVLALLVLPVAAVESSPTGAADALHDLFAREWEDRLERSPRLATSVGRHEYDDRLESVSLGALRREIAAARGFLAELDAIQLDALDSEDRINAQIFRTQLEDRIRDFDFGAHEIPFNADSGFHTGIARLHAAMPFLSVDDYENYLSRLERIPALFEEHIANMRRGIERGMTLPRAVLDGYETTMSAHVVVDPEESVFFEPFQRFPTALPEGDRERLLAAGRRAVTGPVAAAYDGLHRFFVDEYLPAARSTLGASALPDGEAYYAYRIEHFTTLPLSAAEIHRIGLDEVARIRAEMDAIIERVGFEGEFAEFLAFLRTDPRFYPDSAEALLKEASYIAKRADAQLPRLFGTLPRLPYGVAPVPEHMAPKYTAGRYVSAPVGGTEPGYYWVNTYKLESRSLYTLEALTLHEAVPGHHLQGALADEQEGLPNFRRFSYLSAFGEGWGLYSEWLGKEMGFYTDPYSDFGRLTYEMWRACRLVVDTGVHAMGWTRRQVIDYLASHTALSIHECTTETDRYISWPAQALAYKIGELEIKRLREKAEKALGERFDVRRFHDAILLNGSVPLPVLAEQIDRFIAAESRGGEAASRAR